MTAPRVDEVTRVPGAAAARPDTVRSGRGRLRRAAEFLLAALIFAIAYTAQPLYTSNQNHHFLKGLADAGVGFLADDWQVRTVDPFPAFSALVAFTHRYLSDYVFYGYYYLLFAAYLAGVLGLARRMVVGPPSRRGIDAILAAGAPATLPGGRVEALLVFTLFTLLHNEAFGYLFVVDKSHIAWWQMTHWGVAGQEIFGHGAFQASSFGMLLPLAILAFAAGRPLIATAIAAAVVDLHFSYALCSAAVVAAFVALTAWPGRRWGRAAGVAALALVTVAPTLAYTVAHFAPSSPEVAKRSVQILADHLPFEATPGIWIGPTTWAQLGLVVAALAVVRKSRLALTIAVPTAVAVVLTAWQALAGNQMPGLVFPWRPSVLVVPLATGILVTAGVSRLVRTAAVRQPAVRTAIAWGCAAVLFFLVGSGIVRMTLEEVYQNDHRAAMAAIDTVVPSRWRSDFIADLRPDGVPVLRFVARTTARGDVYLIPPDLQRFRSHTGAPAFVDFKSHPYKDVEVIEWKRRLDLADRFYGSQTDCDALDHLVAGETITHVVLDRQRSRTVCPGLDPIYLDDSYAVCRVRGRAPSTPEGRR